MVNAGCFQCRQSGTNQVHHLRVIRVRDGREETGTGRVEGRDEGRQRHGVQDKTWIFFFFYIDWKIVSSTM